MPASTLTAVSIDTNQWTENAKTYLKQAEEIGKRVEGRCVRQQHEQEVKYTLRAAEAFRICGGNHWYDGAKAYGRAATLCTEVLHDSKGAANLFIEAGVVMEKMDSNFANEYYSEFQE